MYEPLGVSLSTSTFPASPCGMWGQLRPRWCPVALGTIPAKQAHCTWTFNFNCWKMRGDAPVLILQALHPASQERPCPLPRPHRSRATGGHQGGSLGMALGGLGPRSQGQGREGASGVWCRAEQCQCLFLGVTLSPGGRVLGPQCWRSQGGRGRDPSIVTATPGTLRQVGSGYRAHSWRVTCPRRGGGSGLGCGCPGSWRTGRAVAVPAGRRSLIVCPQIRNVGSCFLCLRKCRAQGRCL